MTGVLFDLSGLDAPDPPPCDRQAWPPPMARAEDAAEQIRRNAGFGVPMGYEDE